MTTQRFVLIDDSDERSGADSFQIGDRDFALPGVSSWSVSHTTLRGGVSEGVQVVRLQVGKLSVWVLPTRGMGIWKAEYDGIPIGWDSPVRRPVHPAFVPLREAGGLGWLRGFNELVCRCGLTSNGPPVADPVCAPEETAILHGRIANLPAHRVELEVDPTGPGRVQLRGYVRETSVFGSNFELAATLGIIAGEAGWSIVDKVTNRSSTSKGLQLLYHINIGRPFLEAGGKVIAASEKVAPRDARAAEGSADWDTCGGPESGYAEQVYYLQPKTIDGDWSGVMLHNAAANLGLCVRFAADTLPCLAVWKNTAALEDGYVAGLEPATNYPNPRPFEREQGRVVELSAGASFETRLRITACATAEEVAGTAAELQPEKSLSRRTVHSQPIVDWSPGATG